jgi:hypothetical protein
MAILKEVMSLKYGTKLSSLFNNKGKSNIIVAGDISVADGSKLLARVIMKLWLLALLEHTWVE